jgi:hypothetical protein
MDTPISTSIPYGLDLLAMRQLELGGQALLEGRLSFEWEECQQSYLSFIHSHRTGKRWVVQLIMKLWGIAWDMWGHRNGILHQTTVNHVAISDNRDLDLRVQSLYSKLLDMASATDRHLTQNPISDILDKSRQFKRVWLALQNLHYV